MTCRMEWTDPAGGSHRCGATTTHDGLHTCPCGAIFRLVEAAS